MHLLFQLSRALHICLRADSRVAFSLGQRRYQSSYRGSPSSNPWQFTRYKRGFIGFKESRYPYRVRFPEFVAIVVAIFMMVSVFVFSMIALCIIFANYAVIIT